MWPHVQVPRKMIGTDGFQETPIVEVTRQITKHNYLVMDVNDIPRVLKEVCSPAALPGPASALLQGLHCKDSALSILLTHLSLASSKGYLPMTGSLQHDSSGRKLCTRPSDACCADSPPSSWAALTP